MLFTNSFCFETQKKNEQFERHKTECAQHIQNFRKLNSVSGHTTIITFLNYYTIFQEKVFK